MLKADQVPPDSLGEMVRTLSDTGSYAKALAAAINAWPGMQHFRWNELNAAFSSHLILPLPKESGNG